MSEKKRILIAPLNWGLGHASRCIPVINALLSRNAEVVIAADGAPLKLLQQEFPTLESVVLEGVNVQYPKKVPFPIYFGMKLPELIHSIEKERIALAKLKTSLMLDAVISDNRYGLYHKDIPSVLITHQLRPISPLFEETIHQFILKKISHFNECWIPDFKDKPNLSGKLSHLKQLPENARFIGPLSRFELGSKGKLENDLLVILSGPEPKRTELENKILAQLATLEIKTLLVQGVVKTTTDTKVISPLLTSVSHLTAKKLEKAIKQSKVVLCRAGYSSVMDLIKLQKKAILIPTKGQTEQEYLAKKLKAEDLFYTVKEKNLNLKTDVTAALSFTAKDIKMKTENQFGFLEEWLHRLDCNNCK